MLISFFWERRKKIAPGLMLALLRSVMLAPIPVSFKLIIDRCIPSRNLFGIGIIVCCVAVLLSLHYLLAVKGAKKVSARIASIIMELRGRIFLQIQQLSFAYLDQESTGRLLSKYAFDTQKVQTVAMQVLNQLLPNTLYSLCVLLTLIYLNWRLTFLLLLIIPLIAILKFRFFGEIKDAHSKARLAQERLTGAAGESLTALRLVRSFGEEERANWLLEKRSRGVADAFSTSSTVSSQFTTFVSVSNQLLSLVVIAGGAVVAIKAGISMGTLLAFVTGLPALTMPAQMFAQISDQFFQGEESFRSIQELLDCPSLENWTGATKIRDLRGEIEFRDVSFAYPSTKKGAINEISLHIQPGENIALVGPSGSGKSTLASLILGLYRPDRGEIRIDGHLHTGLDMQWLRKQTAIVMQDTILLSGSIADNIRFASTEAGDEEVMAAAALANADEFILPLPDGFNTKVGERGVMLSGGQRQRLAIARAVLRNPRILILDEPTSSLDYHSEQLIQEALERLASHRTVITIAHRLSTVRNADRLITLRHGRIVDIGRFEELSERAGYFRDLLTAQQMALS